MSKRPATYDLSPFGVSEELSAIDLTRIAARAKSCIKANPATGWSLLSKLEILALVWIADVMLTDFDLGQGPDATPEPTVISNI